MTPKYIKVTPSIGILNVRKNRTDSNPLLKVMGHE